MITDEDSEFYGDFICSYKDCLTVADDYTLTATGITSHDENYPTAKVITKAPTVYFTGASKQNSSGFLYTSQVGNANWNYDRMAMSLMNFDTTSDISAADAIVGSSSLNDTVKAAILSGTPYVGYGSGAVPAKFDRKGNMTHPGCTDLLAFEYVSVGGMDCMPYVTYGEKNLINGSYIMDEDDVMYGYGNSYFTAIPEGADLLVKVDGTKAPTEGFMPITARNTELAEGFFGGGILGFSYEGKAADGESDIKVALFANSLTHKVHQRDEYAYISNFIFSSLLGEAYEPTFVAPATGDGFNATLWICLMSVTVLAGAMIVCTKKQYAK
jgi:hypothetical protein